MELFANIVDCVQPLTIFAKHSILGISQGYKCASDKTKQKLGSLSFILQISATFKFNVIFTLLPYGETLLIANSIHVSLIPNWFIHAVEYI